MASGLAKDGMHGAKSPPVTTVAAVTAANLNGAAGANPTQAEYANAVALCNSLKAQLNLLIAACKAKGIHGVPDQVG